MADQITNVPASGDSGGGMGTGMVVGIIVVILIIIGLFIIFGRGVGGPATPGPAAPEGGGEGTNLEGGTGAEINVPDQVDLNVNPGDGGGAPTGGGAGTPQQP